MVMGAMGSEDRMDYTILGDAVNLGARLCSNAARRQILLSEAAYNEIENISWIKTTKLEPIQVKGKSQPIQIYEVAGAQPKTKKGRYQRAEVSWPCTLESDTGIIKAEIKNISAGGILIACQDPPELDESAKVVIKIPDKRSLAVKIEVIWSNINNSNKDEMPREFGARFTVISDEDRRLLLELISDLRGITMDRHDSRNPV